MRFLKILLLCFGITSISPLLANYQLSQIQIPEGSSISREVVHLEESMPDEDIDPVIEPQEFNYWQQFFKMMFILGLILGFVLIVAWILKGYLNKRIKQVNSQNKIKVLERRNLSQKSMLYLVEVEGQKIVLGDSQSGGVQLLMNLNGEPISPDETTKTQDIASKFSFSQILQRKLGRAQRPSPSQNLRSDYEIYEEN